MNNSEVKAREYSVIDNNGDLGNPRVFRKTHKRILKLEGEFQVDVIEYKAYQALQIENEELKARVGVLENKNQEFFECLQIAEVIMLMNAVSAEQMNPWIEKAKQAVKEYLDDSL